MSRMTSFLWIYKEGLQRPDGIFINQDKYVQEILKKFDLECVRTATTPYEAPKPKSKNEPDSPVNVHLYRSMIGSLMYLTASRPDIMFAVSACSRDWNSTLVMSVSGKVDLMAMQETKQFGYHFPLNAEVAEVVPKSVAGSSFPAASSTLLPFDVQSLKGDYYEEIQISAEGSCVQGKTQADWMLLYVVPTVSTKACDDAGKARMESVPGKDYILLPLWTADPPFSQISKSSPDAGFKPSSDDGKKVDEDSRNSEGIDQEKEDNVNSTNNVNAANTNEVNVVCGKTSIELPDDPNMPPLEDIVYSDDDEDVGAEADMNNLDAFMPVSPITQRSSS
ncbi:hypothetical protein Tco_0516519 [Tanacetum coccineum]